MAQIEKNILIKLRQNEASSVPMNNGNYNIILAEPVLLEEGDQARVHTAIIDSSAPNIITIENDIDIEMDVCRYIRYNENYELAAGGPAGNVGVAAENFMTLSGVPYLPTAPPIQNTSARRIAADISKKPTQNMYFASIVNKVGSNAYTVLGISAQRDDRGRGSIRWGDVVIHFEAISAVTGRSTSFPVYIPGRSPVYHFVDANVNIEIIGNDGFSDFTVIENDAFLKSYGIDPNSFTPGGPYESTGIRYGPLIPSTDEEVHCEMYTQTLKFKIPARRYEPAELCTVINDYMSTLGPDFRKLQNQNTTLFPTEFVVDNPFLGTIKEMSQKITAIPKVDGQTSVHRLKFLPGNDDDLPITSALDFDIATITAAKNDMFIGAEEVALSYDPILKKISFSVLHFPIYVSTTGDGSASADSDTFAPGVKWVDGKITPTYGGAMITGLRPVEFWTNQMGFTTNIGIPQYNQDFFWEKPGLPYLPTIPGAGGESVPAVSPSGDKIFPFKLRGIIGTNVTSAFLGLDVPIQKNASYFATNVAVLDQTINTLTSLTTPIWSNRTFNTSPNDEGYFLIEINYNFKQKMVGAHGVNASNNIQCITGKYFTGTNNFLQDQGGGSIDYQHIGEPQLLTDISVRILNADGSNPITTDLGAINSIFIEISKAINVPVPITKK